MKKQSLFLIAMLLMIGVVNSSNAQLSFGGGAHTGLSFAAFPKAIKDFYGMGIGFGAQGDMNIIKYIAIRLNFDYHSFASDKEKIKQLLAAQNGVNAGDLDVSGLNASIVGITVNGLGKIPTGSMVTPYGVIGFGIHIASASDFKVKYQGQDQNVGLTGLGSDTNFGINFGAGAEFKLAAIKLYADFKYVLVFSKGESTGHLPFTVGVSLGG